MTWTPRLAQPKFDTREVKVDNIILTTLSTECLLVYKNGTSSLCPLPLKKGTFYCCLKSYICYCLFAMEMSLRYYRGICYYFLTFYICYCLFAEMRTWKCPSITTGPFTINILYLLLLVCRDEDLEMSQCYYRGIKTRV